MSPDPQQMPPLVAKELRLLRARLPNATGDDAWQAAVLVLISNERRPKLLLSRRADRLSSHAGEVAFLGGRRDAGERCAVQSALREAFEEANVPTGRVDVLGFLPAQTTQKGVRAQPVVGALPKGDCAFLRPNPGEVARLFWVDLAYFARTPPAPYRVFLPKVALTIETPAWRAQGEIVWGLTGRIIADLLWSFGVRVAWYYRPVLP